MQQIRKVKNNLIIIYLFSLLFEAFSFGNIGKFQLTVTFIVSVFLLVFSFIDFLLDNKDIDLKHTFVSIIFLLAMLCGFLFGYEKSSYTSFLLYFYYLCLFFFTRHTDLSYRKIRLSLNIYLFLLALFSIYGFYQFFALNLSGNFPLKELIPESLLTSGYNTHGISYIGGHIINRPHSIYLEPSSLSQFSAIGIGLGILGLIRGKKDGSCFNKKLCVFAIVSCALGLISSLSGSGIVLLVLLLLYLFRVSKQKNKIAKIIVFLSIIAIIAFLLRNTSFFQYYVSRLSELNFHNTAASSGRYRFVLPMQMSIDTMFNGRLFGYGLGNDSVAMTLYKATEDSVGNGYFKVFLDMGIFGFIALLLLLFSVKPKKLKDDYQSFFFIVALVMNAIGGTFMLPTLWVYIILINGKWNYRSFYRKDIIALAYIGKCKLRIAGGKV